MDKKYTIFFADDDEEDQFLFETALKEADTDAELFTVPDGNALIDLAINFSKLPTIIILDINMPKKDGISCLSEIRAIKKFDCVPIIMFSSTADEEVVESAFSLGADCYIQKPSSFSDLIGVIQFCLRVGLKNNKRSKEDFLVIYSKKRKVKN